MSIYPIEIRKARRYQVSEQLTAKLRDLSVAGAAISDAVNAGGNGTTLNGVSFALEDNASAARQRQGQGVRGCASQGRALRDAVRV